VTRRQTLAIALVAFIAILASVNYFANVARKPAQSTTPATTAGAPIPTPSVIEPETEIYETAQIQSEGTGWHISGSGLPGGLFLRYRLDPSKRYAITISGEVAETHVNLRIRRDGGEAEYLDAPSGMQTLEAEAAASLEILFYADTAFSYHLREVKITPVGDAAHMSAMELPAALAPIFPGLKPELDIYGAGAIARKTNMATIWNSDATGGLISRFTLDRNKRYELRVVGAPRRLNTTMRLRLDDGNAEYLEAPNGAWTRVVEQASHLELMLYADAHYVYSLESISIHSCDLCTGDLQPTDVGITDRAAPVLQRIAADWSATVTGTALLDRHTDGVVLRTTDSSGLALERELPEDSRLLIRYRGVSLDGRRPSLRIRQGKDAPQYFPMVDGPGQVMIAGPGPVEALIYQEQGISYRLDEFTTSICKGCIGNKPRDTIDVATLTNDPESITVSSPALGQEDYWRISGDVNARISAMPDGSLAIASEAIGNGIRFTQLVLPNSKYRLQLQTGNIVGHQVVRLRQEDKSEVWHVLDGNELDLTFSDTRFIEVMVYGDAGSTSVLRKLTLEPCPDCPGDDTLRAKIVSALPGIEAELENRPLAAAQRILGWISNAADYAASPGVEEASRKLPFYDWSAGQIYYKLFLPNKAAFYCGGLAEFGVKVFRLFGFRASTISFGVDETDLTHSTIVLRFDRDGKADFFIFDPTFNAVLRKQGASDMPGLASMLAKNGIDRLIVQEGRLERDYIALRAEAARKCKSTKPIDGQWLLCELTVPFSLNKYFHNHARQFKAHGLHADIRGLIQLMQLGVSSIASDPATDDRDQLIALLKRNKVPTP
jgi:hypothetical protein